MVMSKVKYEELRQQRVEENKRRLEELHLPLLSLALKNASPKPSPKVKPRVIRTELVPLRRSPRVAKSAAPEYAEVTYYERILPRRASCPRRDLSNRVYASDKDRAVATVKAEKLEASLESKVPTFVRSMLPSHVSGGFWLGLPSYFCRRNLPARDETVTLIDESGAEWPTVYLARKTGLSGGWKKFAVDHDLVDGDALVFQLIKRAVFKVYITRLNNLADDDGSETSND
ncbi:PREDICTED: B3 domain-containing protein At3g19184-like isoform X2 [Ipomoea nil]|uniref:B3 domain-containing protein At3g19184-like isoform X2 n=1 Tax=Ipomoea nil TaxID=35883 RepID=UPI0009010AF3|nr:PREDICTED: B3 domain-containing protein At3g19184-like isoform X2 [Ipomoea nil]